MSGGQATEPVPDPGVRNYTFLGLTCLLVLLLVLAARGLGAWALLPALLGLVALQLRWRAGPLLVVLTLAGMLYLVAAFRGLEYRGQWAPSLPAGDLLLAAALLGYVAAHYRLLGLTRSVLPRDPRRPAALRPGGRPALAPPPRRSPDAPAPAELGLLLAALPAFAALALACRHWLLPRDAPPPPAISGPVSRALASYDVDAFLEPAQLLVDVVWRGRLLLWYLGGAALLVAALLGYLGWRRLSAAEATLYLQDTAWAETRREQRRIDSWLVWARRQARRKEGP